jgi:glycosyltransferase A (GT-A) superfamily protein (DUF2064 family)
VGDQALFCRREAYAASGGFPPEPLFEDVAFVRALVGSDVPGLPRGHLLEAFSALRPADLVLGPTPDGGYYLIGMNGPQPALFQDMPWSTPQVLPRTRARAAALSLRTTFLEELRDVDTIEDLRALGAGLAH